MRRGRADRPKREESIEDALVDEVQIGLKRVEKFVQAARDDLLDIRVGKLRAQLAEALFGAVAIHSRGVFGSNSAESEFKAT